jgi:hypothetical protein
MKAAAAGFKVLATGTIPVLALRFLSAVTHVRNKFAFNPWSSPRSVLRGPHTLDKLFEGRHLSC